MNAGICRGCGAAVLWTKTTGGRAVPLDAKSEKRFVVTANASGQEAVELVPTYLSHFVACPAAALFRRRQAAE